MAESIPVAVAVVGVNAVMGITELGVAILGFVHKTADLCSAALVNKRFNRAARFWLWQAVCLPYLPPPILADDIPFWDRYASLLQHRTLSMLVDMGVVSPSGRRKILARRWEASVQGPDCVVLKAGLDAMFDGLGQTLTRTKRLSSFAARDVPRVLDLIRLLQSHRPDIQSIRIEASSRDTFGLCALPTLDINHWLHKILHIPSLTVPLANSVNLRGPISSKSVFAFANLRVLSLTNLQYDAQLHSPFVAPLVAILKGAPNLFHLELSLRHQIGGLALAGDFVELMYGVLVVDQQRHFLKELCVRYKEAGGQPLQLQTLRLGYGCEILDDLGYNPIIGPHYLSRLTHLHHLAELHFESLNHKDGTNLVSLGVFKGHLFLPWPYHPQVRLLSNLRKMTWPWRFLMGLWEFGNPGVLQHITLRIDIPAPSDWGHDGYPSWVLPKYLFTSPRLRALKLRGLVLPAEQMCPEDTNRFLCLVSSMTPMASLKIRMPHLTGAKAKSGRRAFWRRLAMMNGLRELWLAPGLGSWDPQTGEGTQDPYPTDAEFRRFTRMIASKCPRLTYLRILDRAWHITRPGEDGADPVFKPLTAWQVEHQLPEAFDWSMPTVL